jgi:uncharacterized protein (DUF302 family)
MRKHDMQGLTTVPSNFGPKETMDRLETELRAQGITVFARIDHAAGAVEAGLPQPGGRRTRSTGEELNSSKGGVP